MTVPCIWSCGVDYDLATALLDAGRGRLILQWDDRIWHYWRQLGWDGRPTSERDRQPPEVQVYAITPADVRLLGVWLAEDAPCVLFICRDLGWASVVGDTLLVTDDAPDFVPPGVGRLT